MDADNKVKFRKACSCGHREGSGKQRDYSSSYCCAKIYSSSEEFSGCCARACRPRPQPCSCKKDLSNERKHAAKLEVESKNLALSVERINKDGELRTTSLREALERTDEQLKLATRSRNLSMQLAKQSRDQTETIKTSRDEIFGQILNVQLQLDTAMCENTKLSCECQDMNCKLKATSQKEAKKCAEVADEVGRIKCAVQKKEGALLIEKVQLNGIIAELTNVVKIQKKRICELSGICNNQQVTLKQRDRFISEKEAKICELQYRFDSMSCTDKEMNDKIEHLKCCLDGVGKICTGFKKDLDESREKQRCEQQIKAKIIEDQDNTIKKLKKTQTSLLLKLVQESEKMAKRAAREFEQLTAQLHSEIENNSFLQATLETAQAHFVDKLPSKCSNCQELENEIGCIGEQKQKALVAAKYMAQKLHEATIGFQKQLECERRQQRFNMIILQRKEEEIECLKRKLMHGRGISSQMRDDCIN